MIRKQINRPKITNLLGGWTKLYLNSEYVQKYISDCLKTLNKEEIQILPENLNIRVYIAAAQIVHGTNIYLEFTILNLNLFVQCSMYIKPGKEANVQQLYIQKIY